jgi:oxalate---CoA ligase
VLSISGIVRSWSEATPESPVLLASGRRPLSYRDLHAQIEQVGANLAALGIGRRDRVALVLPNGPEAATAFLGVASAAVCAPLNPAFRHAEFDFYFSDLGARSLVVASERDSPAREIARRRQLPILELSVRSEAGAGSFELEGSGSGKTAGVDPADVALVLHTSGTTSKPKLVPLTHRNLCSSAQNVANVLGLRADDRCLNVMPFFHIHGLVGALLSSLTVGGSVICAPGFRAPSFMGWLSELEPTWYTAVPTVHQAVLARAGENAEAIARSRLRFIRSSSASLPPQVQEELERTFNVPVIESYGMTEAAHQMASNPLPPLQRKPGSVGVAAGPEIAVLDEAGRMLPAGGTGEVAIRGESVFSGYENAPDADVAAFANGWFRTGDEGSLDDEGYLFLRGRLKEIINRGGEKVSPLEVESALLSHPEVAETVVFSIPDERLGEEVGAAVVLYAQRKITVRELQEFVASSLADFKVPRAIVVVEEIPKGATGKLQRIGLADQLGLTGAETPEPVAHTTPRTPLEEELAGVWAATLGISRVGVEDDFFSLGGDSILGADVLARVGERYGRDLPLSTLLWAPTVAALAKALEGEAWDQDSLLVPIQTEGSSPPLFVTHALGNEVFNVSMLKGPLGDDQPLYAVRARLDRLDYASVEDLAVEYVEEVRSVQPSGPYCFASVCSGAALVIEMARRVQELGERVGLAAVIDPLPARRPRAPYHACRIVVHARNRRLRGAVARRLRRALPSNASRVRSPGEAEDFFHWARAIQANYRLRHLPATLSVFSTMDYETPRGYWSRFADRVDWYELAAPHVTIFHHPHVELLGELLSSALGESRVA